MAQRASEPAGMDIVYLVKNNSDNDSQELRYSLRSLKNIPHRKVYIVGEKPEWVRNVEFIPILQDKSKMDNVMTSMTAAVNHEAVSEDFILMNDDFFFMKRIEALPALNFGLIEEVIARYEYRYPEGSRYISSMKRAHQLLVERGIAHPLSYELHVPMMFNKHKAMTMLRDEQWPYHIRSYYGNIYATNGQSVDDVKVFLEQRHNASLYQQDPEKYLDEQLFLSATGGSFGRGLVGDFIRSRFSETSMYER